MQNIHKSLFALGVFGALQFLVLTTLAMLIYPGGTIHNPNLEAYSFLYNYFSDLGRLTLFDGGSNWICHLLFKIALTTGGLCLMLFFIGLPFLFKKGGGLVPGLLAALLGLVAGWSYVGIAWIPWDVSYWGHVGYVKQGFLAFLAMSLFYTLAIFLNRHYPRHYGYVFLFFTFILAIQVVIMLFGPRAYRSNDALFLQAVAQKIVVYAEILCLLYQSYGALRLSREIKPLPE